MLYYNIFSLILMTMLLAPANDKPAQDSRLNPESTQSSTAVEGKFVVDEKESKLLWKGSNLFNFNEHSGKVNISKGELTVEKDKLATGTVEVDMNTIMDTDNAQMLIDHLKSADFFDTKAHPRANFKLTKVEPLKNPEPGKENFDITGDLTIKGITNPVKFPARVEVGSNLVRVDGRFIIDRTKWNVKYNSGKFFENLGDDTISDAIQFNINLRAKK